MKIILLEDVKDVGKKDEVIDVNPGYARNFLIAKGKAEPATDKNMLMLKQRQKKAEEKLQAEIAECREIAEKLEKAELTLNLKRGKNDRVFGSISTKDISEAIKTSLGIDIDKKKISLSTQIKSPGRFTVTIKLHKEVVVDIKISVGTV